MQHRNQDGIAEEHGWDAKRSETSNDESHNKGKSNDNNKPLVDRIKNSGKDMLSAAFDSSQQSYGSSDILRTKNAGSARRGYESIVGESSASQTSGKYVYTNAGPSAFRSSSNASSSGHEFESFLSNAQQLPAAHSQQPEIAVASAAASSYSHMSDGQAVVQLLSTPDEMETLEAHGTSHELLLPGSMATLRETLFSSNPTNTRWDNLLNFSPDFAHPVDAGYRGKAKAKESAELQMGIGDVDAAGKLWLEQWSTVLSSYNDEVWGEIGPLVAEARQETAALSHQEASDGQSHSLKAVNRLRQILAHVRGSV